MDEAISKEQLLALDDDALLRMYQRTRDERVFAAFAQRVSPGGLSVAGRSLRNREDARDVVQRSLTAVTKGIGGWSGAFARAWFFGIVRHKCADEHRTRARRDALLSSGDDCDPTETRLVPAPDAQAVRKEEAEAIRECFERLGPLADVATLKWIDGLSLKELADVLRMDETDARNAVRRAHYQLKECLSRKLPELASRAQQRSRR